jgi:hypothetical protein
MGGKRVAVPAKALTISINDISFSADFEGSDMRFKGSRSGSALGGTLEVWEKGKTVATGTWRITRAIPEEKTLDGTWTGSLTATQKPAQRIDPNFDASVRRPAYINRHPRVLFDEAHNNIHTTGGLYKPFVDLITNDGYLVLPNKEKFTAASLKGFDILVISNATGPRGQRAKPAFTDEESDAVQEWVRNGGSLLFIADHAPMGAAAEILARRFSVDMSKAYTDDPASKDRVLGDITFSRANKLLAHSPITKGRNKNERVTTIITFTGQSLKGPLGSVSLLTLPSTAVDTDPQTKKSAPAAGRSQGLSFRFGSGRVVVLGEAAMLTAQIDAEERPFGMNYPGSDNKQFALNLMHWLSSLLRQ